MGMYTTTALLYIGYLFMVSLVSWQWIYPYSAYKVFSLETFMWMSNGGFILYEFLEFESKGALYFSMDSIINVFDIIISVNWAILFFLRFSAAVWTGSDYMGDPAEDPSIDRAGHPELEGESAWTRTDPTKRNESYTIIFMAFWSVQMIVLWIRTVGLLQRTEIMGPLLKMMLYVAKDVASFLIVVIAVTFGFLFAVHFIVAGDIDRDVTCEVLTPEYEFDGCEEAEININSARAILIYLIQTLLGQQEWSVLNENLLYGFGRLRAQLLTMVILGYVLLGTILSLNMLIAIMTNSFELLNDKAAEQLAFLRVETTYDLGHRGRLMPPPYNVFVIAVWLLITGFNMLIKGLSCGKCKLNLDRLNPFYIGFLRRGTQHGKSSMIRRNDKSDVSFSAKKEVKDIQQKLQKIQSKRRMSVSAFDEDEDEAKIDDTPKLESQMSSRIGYQFEKFADFFEQIDSIADDTRKRYCKHCYCRMKDVRGGRIDDYFAMFESGSGGNQSFGLDVDDMRMIKRLFRYCSLCPQCFRPYGWRKKPSKEKGTNDAFGEMDTDRHDRHHVLMEVISCYFFLLLVWIPLVIICFLPALFSKIFARVNDMEQTKYASNKQLNAGAFGDYHGGPQQHAVRSIVDLKYHGNKTFDENESDDERNDDHSEQTRLERMVQELTDKLDAMNAAQIESEEKQSKKPKKTTAELQKKQRRINKQNLSKSRNNSLNSPLHVDDVINLHQNRPRKVKFEEPNETVFIENDDEEVP